MARLKSNKRSRDHLMLCHRLHLDWVSQNLDICYNNGRTKQGKTLQETEIET